MMKKIFALTLPLFALTFAANAFAQDLSKEEIDERFKKANARCYETWYRPLQDLGEKPIQKLCDCLEGKMRELELVPGEKSQLEEVFGPPDTNATPEAYNRCMEPFFKEAHEIQQRNKKAKPGNVPAPPQNK